jgi:hypothetical protein
VPELVAAELRVNPQGRQHQQVPAELHPRAGHQIGPLHGQHLGDVGELLVHGVQGVEQLDQPGVGNDAQTRVPDVDFFAVAVLVALIPDQTVD